jgi:hypothetical protein
MSMTIEDAASVLAVDASYYSEWENGLVDLPIAVWRRCVAIAKDRPESVIATSLPRDRWVRMVQNSLAYLQNEHHLSSLIRNERWEEIADFIDFMRTGPHMDLAITDPHLFKKLREAGTRAHLSGLMHFRGPAQPYPSHSLRRHREHADEPERPAPTAFRTPKP